MIDFRLQVFCSVARHLSFTKASKELLVSQPAISKHIQELEAEYGTQLFVRKSSGISLTDAGELLRIHAERILNAYRMLDSEMNLLAQYPCGELRLGASPMIAAYIQPHCLTGFQERFKSIELSLLCGSAQTITRAVANGEIEVGMVEIEQQESGLRYTPFRAKGFSTAQEFYFVQKLDAAQGLATAFMRYIAHHP